MAIARFQLREDIARYIRRLDGHGFDTYRSDRLLPYYAPLIEHVLIEHGLANSKLPMRARIQKAFNGKRVIEIGCRNGQFLRFLKMHGAQVAGSTSPTYLDSAQERLGKGTLLVKANAEKVGESKVLQKFGADFIFSFNLFDANRWAMTGIYDRAIEQIRDSFHKLAKPGTHVYVLPSFDTTSVLTERDFRILGKRLLVKRNRKHPEDRRKPHLRSTFLLKTKRRTLRQRPRAKRLVLRQRLRAK